MKNSFFSPSRLVWQRGKIERCPTGSSFENVDEDSVELQKTPTSEMVHEQAERTGLLSAKILRRVEQLNMSGDKLEAGKLMGLFELLKGDNLYPLVSDLSVAIKSSNLFRGLQKRCEGLLPYLEVSDDLMFRKLDEKTLDLATKNVMMKIGATYRIIEKLDSDITKLSQAKLGKIPDGVDKTVPMGNFVKWTEECITIEDPKRLLAAKKNYKNLLLGQLHRAGVLSSREGLDTLRSYAIVPVQELMDDDFPIEGELDVWAFNYASTFHQESIILDLIEKMLSKNL